MDGLASTLAGLLQIAGFALIAPLVVGLLRLVESRIQLRAGPPLFQPYAELWKLLVTKRGTAATTTSWVFAAAPGVAFSCYALLAWAVPPIYPVFAPLDFLAVVYLLALGRFVIALAGLDTGTPFGGMGSSREMFLTVIVATYPCRNSPRARRAPTRYQHADDPWRRQCCLGQECLKRHRPWLPVVSTRCVGAGGVWTTADR